MAFLRLDMSDMLTTEHLENLNKANIWTTNDICSMELMEIKRLTNIKYHILKDVQEKIRQRYTLPCDNLSFLLEKTIRECRMCPTGLPELTSALEGGFQTQEIVELCGDSECGKTEMCYLLCGEILSHYDNYHILYVASNFDFDQEKVAKYIRVKAGSRELSDEDIFQCLTRVQIARPTKLSDLVSLLHTSVHSDKRNLIKCIIIDSLSFIIQEDLLESKTFNFDQGGDQLDKFKAFIGDEVIKRTTLEGVGATDESKRKNFTDIYLHEVMRLLTHVAKTKNVIIVITNSDQQLTGAKSWSNAIDHRIHLARMSEFSRYYLHNPRSTVRRATILKTIHNISKIGYTIPFAINDEGLFAIRLANLPDTTGQSISSES